MTNLDLVVGMVLCLSLGAAAATAVLLVRRGWDRVLSQVREDEAYRRGLERGRSERRSAL